MAIKKWAFLRQGDLRCPSPPGKMPGSTAGEDARRYRGVHPIQTHAARTHTDYRNHNTRELWALKMQTRKPLRILIVEDDEQDALLLKMAFDEIDVDARIRFVGGGKEAMDYLQGASVLKNKHALPNLLVLDLKMPCVSGFEVLQWLRSQLRLKSLFVAVLSGSEWKADHERAFATGADFCAVKPLEFRQLVATVKGMLNAYSFPLSSSRREATPFSAQANGSGEQAPRERIPRSVLRTEP